MIKTKGVLLRKATLALVLVIIYFKVTLVYPFKVNMSNYFITYLFNYFID